jgi:hypothetical protein
MKPPNHQTLHSSVPARIPLKLAAMALGFAPADGLALARHGLIPSLGPPNGKGPCWVNTNVLLKLANDGAWLRQATEFCYQANHRT